MISEVVVHPIKQTSKGLVAYISYIYNNELKINDCAIYTSPKRTSGYRILFPIKQLSNGTRLSCVYPINKYVGMQIEESLIQEYKNFLGKFGIHK